MTSWLEDGIKRNKKFVQQLDPRISSLPETSNSKFFLPDESSKSTVVKRGWLEKQSRNIFAPWKRKWVVLTEIGLSCYDNDFENKTNSSHNLMINKDVVEVNNTPNNYTDNSFETYGIQKNDNNDNSNNKFIFKIYQSDSNKQSLSSSLSSSSSKKVEIFAASSERERKEWLKCLKKVLFARFGGAIFGASLSETLQNRNNSKQIVPEIVEMCCMFLLQYALKVEGLFRHSSKSSTVKDLRGQFDRGERPSLFFPSQQDHTNDNSTTVANHVTSHNNNTTLHNNNSTLHNNNSTLPSTITYQSTTEKDSSNLITSQLKSYTEISTPPLSPPTTSTPTSSNIHAVSCLLKTYLLDLPEPIIPVSFYEAIMTIVTRCYKIEPLESVRKIGVIVKGLPIHSYNILSYLCAFLHTIGQHQADNKMTHSNLAKIFCNAILKPEVDDAALLMGTADNRATALGILITNKDEMFVEKFKRKKSTGVCGEVARWRSSSEVLAVGEDNEGSFESRKAMNRDSAFDKLFNIFPKFRANVRPKEVSDSYSLLADPRRQPAGAEGAGGSSWEAVRRWGSEERVAAIGGRSRCRMGRLDCDKMEENGADKYGEKGQGLGEGSNPLHEGLNVGGICNDKRGVNGDDEKGDDEGGIEGVSGEGGSVLRSAHMSSSLMKLFVGHNGGGDGGGEDEDGGGDGGGEDEDGDDDSTEEIPSTSESQKDGSIVDINNNNALLRNINSINNTPINNNDKKNESDQLPIADESATPTNSWSLDDDVTSFLVEQGIPMQAIGDSTTAHNKRSCIIGDWSGDLKGPGVLRGDYKALIMTALSCDHERMEKDSLLHLCLSLKKLLYSEHRRAIGLESQLKSINGRNEDNI